MSMSMSMSMSPRTAMLKVFKLLLGRGETNEESLHQLVHSELNANHGHDGEQSGRQRPIQSPYSFLLEDLIRELDRHERRE